jgi:hypothetical protein
MPDALEAIPGLSFTWRYEGLLVVMLLLDYGAIFAMFECFYSQNASAQRRRKVHHQDPCYKGRDQGSSG